MKNIKLSLSLLLAVAVGAQAFPVYAMEQGTNGAEKQAIHPTILEALKNTKQSDGSAYTGEWLEKNWEAARLKPELLNQPINKKAATKLFFETTQALNNTPNLTNDKQLEAKAELARFFNASNNIDDKHLDRLTLARKQEATQSAPKTTQPAAKPEFKKAEIQESKPPVQRKIEFQEAPKPIKLSDVKVSRVEIIKPQQVKQPQSVKKTEIPAKATQPAVKTTQAPQQSNESLAGKFLKGTKTALNKAKDAGKVALDKTQNVGKAALDKAKNAKDTLSGKKEEERKAKLQAQIEAEKAKHTKEFNDAGINPLINAPTPNHLPLTPPVVPVKPADVTANNDNVPLATTKIDNVVKDGKKEVTNDQETKIKLPVNNNQDNGNAGNNGNNQQPPMNNNQGNAGNNQQPPQAPVLHEDVQKILDAKKVTADQLSQELKTVGFSEGDLAEFNNNGLTNHVALADEYTALKADNKKDYVNKVNELHGLLLPADVRQILATKKMSFNQLSQELKTAGFSEGDIADLKKSGLANHVALVNEYAAINKKNNTPDAHKQFIDKVNELNGLVNKKNISSMLTLRNGVVLGVLGGTALATAFAIYKLVEYLRGDNIKKTKAALENLEQIINDVDNIEGLAEQYPILEKQLVLLDADAKAALNAMIEHQETASALEAIKAHKATLAQAQKKTIMQRIVFGIKNDAKRIKSFFTGKSKDARFGKVAKAA